MLQKFKIIPCAFILCLFGLTLITPSPVRADDSPEFIACHQHDLKGRTIAALNCFKELARDLAPVSPVKYRLTLVNGKSCESVADVLGRGGQGRELWYDICDHAAAKKAHTWRRGEPQGNPGIYAWPQRWGGWILYVNEDCGGAC